jgi:cellulose synthase operon protein C
MSTKARTALLLAFATAAVSCATAPRTMPAYPIGPSRATWDEDALSKTIDSFYGAKTAAEATRAVEDAIRIAPDAPATHEIESALAELRGDEDAAFEHLYLALASRLDDAPYNHLAALLDLSLTTSQYRELLALFGEIVAAHPNEGVRRVAAAYAASWQRRLNADPVAADAALDQRGLVTHFALISPFENDDGKGFATEFPPERELDLEASYDGTLFPARWRVDVPVDHQRNLDLGDLVSPQSNVTAYANTYVKVPEEGPYAIRVTTSDAIRVWVNDLEVLSQQQITTDNTDQFVVPVVLRAGWNRVLVKTCHGSGGWRLGLAVTGADGRLVPGIESSAKRQDVKDGPAPGDGYDFEADLGEKLGRVREPMRQMYLATELASGMGLAAEAQNLCDVFRSAAPRSLVARYESASIDWRNNRAGETIDTLDTLIEENGDAAPLLRVFRATFYLEQDRIDKSRDDLKAAIAANPRYRSARILLAANYQREGWSEDQLAAELENAALWPDDTRALWGLAGAYTDLGRRKEAKRVHEEILGQWRGAQDILEAMIDHSLSVNDFRGAEKRQRAICRIYPNTPSCYVDLGDILRRAGRVGDAIAAYDHARAIDDRWAMPLEKLGAIAYESGDKARAVALWKEGLSYDPDNHSLADRIEYVAPSDAGLLGEYAPTEDEIREILAHRGEIQVAPGSNVVMLLDHAVEQMELDGSSRKIVTQILMAVNDTGRDQLTAQMLEPGRRKLYEAYAISPDGARSEATSVRDDEVRFGDLKVGSTIVIQYRLDSYPMGYLARYPDRRWFFHAPGGQFQRSEYVLALPKEMPFSEWGKGSWKRTEKLEGERRVLTYRADDVPPLVGEPGTPALRDLLSQVIVSMNPSWDHIAEWDKALLVDAFRSTPETKKIAEELTRGLKTVREKLDALTRFVMQDVRYQQDYENTIAGVKPHAADVVLQRGYGDCKDKSVLLMTLAREVGIETRLALLRSTVTGDFIRELPFLQFNHAIVYVPKQVGLDAGTFLDATPDTLDLATLRPDDQGTSAMTIDPVSGKWEFVDIPFAPAESQFTLRTATMEPAIPADGAGDGKSRVELKLVFQGPTAARIRQVLRNSDDTQVFASELVNQLFPGAVVEKLDFSGHDDIVKPLTLSLSLTTDALVRVQGDTMVVDVPKGESLSQLISLKERKLPLQTNYYLSYVEALDEVVVPAGYEVVHMPPGARVENAFFKFERESVLAGDRLRISMRFTEKTTRIAPEQYPAYRDAVSSVVENLKQDVVLGPIPTKGKAAKKAKAAAAEPATKPAP